ncbi:MAG: hypothetical protein NTU66_01905 [Elusimicrobia bacterium]|nr:hypothetical protein [Elusimicrobiota bacterium]
MKIGAVSWIRKGTYFENARLLSRHVDYVELLVHTWDAATKELLEKELPLLRTLPLSYTVHLPVGSIFQCRAAYQFFHAHKFPVQNFVLHPLAGWQNFIAGKNDITLENLIGNYPLYTRMTIDIGHLVLARAFPLLALNNTARISIKSLHIHGVWHGKDHCMLNERTINYIKDLRQLAPAFAAAMNTAWITFEVFDYKKLLISIRRFKHAF